MKNLSIVLFLLSLGWDVCAQSIPAKRDTSRRLEEVNVRAAMNRKIESELKMAVSVDEFLASSDHISFIKRGAYAWEPLLNNMSTERSTITIDGMHVFGACTDKMDPITSYVESNNLSAIDIKSGQDGNMHGATVAGSIDLKRLSTPFGLQKKIGGTYQTGFEFNNKQAFNLGNLFYSTNNFVADGSIAFRQAGNYKGGNNKEVLHSQYNKLNASLGLAYKTSPLSAVRLDAIFDRAKDVGFPALPMDLWLSRAIITSASYKQFFETGLVQAWDTKVYFNAVEHYMDDTTRPENLVHMDMPGWSTTYGLVSKLNVKKNRYISEIQLNAYNNLSIAEMRMYPQDRSKQTMFAYSWPWVTTRFTSLAINNSWDISDRSKVHLGGSLGWNYNFSKYVEFNWIFHPGTPQKKDRWLPSLHAGYELNLSQLDMTVGAGFGHRAPSVSEGYGYYIYNSFDRYDYIGNPDLKNEISYEANASVGFKSEKLRIAAKVNYFYISNYIIGRILSMGSPMNYQSVGVKGYTSLTHATLFNTAVNMDYKILDNLQWKTVITYARAKDNEGGNLPFIRPLSYQTAVHYTHKRLGVRMSLNGDFSQTNYSPEYGEDLTAAYKIWNVSADYSFNLGPFKSVFQLGAENLLNEFYSTYADWGNIPRMGRNIFTSLKVNF